MATDLVELLSRLGRSVAPLPSYLDQNFTENATRRAPQAVAFIPPLVVPIPEPAAFFIGFGGASEDACGFLASATVTGDNGSFCNCNTFTGAIFAAASTGTWYVSDGSQYVSVSIVSGNPVATVTSACSACATTTTSTTTTTTTLDCAQTGSAFPTSSLDCVLTGSVTISVDPPPTTTTTTTSTTTTTTTLCPIDCALTGSAIPSINDECGLTGSVYPIPVPPPPTTTTTSTTTTTTTVPPTTTTTTTVAPTTTTSTTTSTTTVPPTTTTSTTTSTTTALSVWYQLTNCADSSIGYSQEYPFGTFAINDRVTSPGITWVVTGTQLVDPGGTLYALTATGFTNCPTTTTTSTTTSTTTAEPTTTTSTTTSTTTAEPTTTTSTTTSTTTVTPTTTTSTTTSTTTAPVYTYGLGVDSVSGANACTDFSISPVTYYSAAAALADGVVLYQDGALSTVAPDNYYSDGISNWLIVSGNGTLTNETSCPI